MAPLISHARLIRQFGSTLTPLLYPIYSCGPLRGLGSYVITLTPHSSYWRAYGVLGYPSISTEPFNLRSLAFLRFSARERLSFLLELRRELHLLFITTIIFNILSFLLELRLAKLDWSPYGCAYSNTVFPFAKISHPYYHSVCRYGCIPCHTVPSLLNLLLTARRLWCRIPSCTCQITAVYSIRYGAQP